MISLRILFSLLAGLAAIGIVSGLSVGILKWPKIFLLKRRFRKNQINHEIFDLIAGWLKAGLSLEEIWGLLVSQDEENPSFGESARWLPVRQRFELIFEEDKWALARAVLQMGHESGGRMAEAMAQCALIYRRKSEVEKRARLLTAEGRLSAWIVGLSPFGFMALLFFVAPDLVSPLFFTTAGRFMLGLAALLSITGIYFVKKITLIKA